MTRRADNTHELERAVSQYIDRHALLPAGQRVVVGVSGGADSVALLRVLTSAAARRGGELIVAHLDHGLRADAPEDAAFVAELAGRWGLPLEADRIDVAELARREGVGTEEAAREARYRFLAGIAGRRGAARVAVGHHRDDQVETVLHRILRGTHVRGLGGMRPQRPLAEEALLVRPLLCVGRSEIERYLRDLGQRWRTDATNVDTRLTRNAIRHELLPLLRRRVNPRLDDALLRLADAARQADRALTRLAEDALQEAVVEDREDAALVVRAEALAGLDPAVAAVAGRLLLERLGVGLQAFDAGHFERLALLLGGGEPSAVTLPGAFEVRRERGWVLFSPREPTDPWSPDRPFPLNPEGETSLPDGQVVCCRSLGAGDRRVRDHLAEPGSSVEMIDADRLAGGLIARPRREGDRFHPLGCSGTQSVSDFLTNARLDADGRRRVRCICDGEGIVYLAPLRIDHRVRLRQDTRRVLRIEVEGSRGEEPSQAPRV